MVLAQHVLAAQISPATEAGADTVRPLAQRLKATLRRGAEANPPHVLRKLLEDLRAAADEQVSEVEGARHAKEVMAWYAQATAAQRQDLWLLLCELFGPDAQRIEAARTQYEKPRPHRARPGRNCPAPALVSARTRVLQRFSVPEGGMRFLVDLRAELLALPKSDKRFAALDAELEHLFSTWFDVAFLELRRLSWDSPASLLEKLIQYEAVHDIRSWADLKNRLDSDRRCYGFFHPRMPNEPLIFVEVALLDKMAGSITPAGRNGRAGGSGQGHHGHLLFHQQHPDRPQGRELRRFADQACGRDAAGGVPKLKQFATLAHSRPAQLAEQERRCALAQWTTSATRKWPRRWRRPCRWPV
jgi:hypothetical protein